MDWENISFQFDDSSILPKYQQLARKLREYIHSSSPLPGTRLPGNRVLADLFGTTAVTVSKALDELAKDGLVECRPQSGTYICDPALPSIRRIAVFCHKIELHDYGFSGPIMDTLHRKFAADGYQIFSTVAAPERYLPLMDEFQAAGAVVIAPREEFFTQIQRLRDENIPIVAIGTAAEEYSDFAFGTNHSFAAEKAVRYLYGLGHRRIGIVAGSESISVKRRRSGYASAMWKLGLPVNPEWEFNGDDDEKLEGAFAEVFSGKEHPGALLLTASEQVIKIYNLCRKYHIDIPGDISLISFLDSGYVSQLNPPMTVIGQYLESFTIQAAEQLEKMIRREKISAPEENFSDGRLVERGSCRRV